MGQYSEYYDSDEPTPVPGGYPWASTINGSLERLDRSTQAMVQLFLDDGVAYAIHEGDVLASGTNHGRVIQAAADWVFANEVTVGNGADRLQLAGWIDGGSETYSLDRQVVVNDQIGLANMDLNVGGADLGGSAALRVAPDSRRYLEGATLDNVTVRNNGNGAGIRLHQCGLRVRLRETSAYGNAGDGISVEGGVGVSVIGGHGKGNDGDGYVITDTANSHGNLNRLYYVNASDNRQAGGPSPQGGPAGRRYRPQPHRECECRGQRRPWRVARQWGTDNDTPRVLV